MHTDPQMKMQKAQPPLKEGSTPGETGFFGFCSRGNKAKTPHWV